MSAQELNDSDLKPKDTGFTLLEVLVALAILGLVVAFLTETISDSLLRAGRIGIEDRATTLAEATLARLGNDIPLRIGISQGEQSDLYWQLVVNPEQGASTVIPLDQIDLKITTKAGHVIGRWETLRVAPQTAVP